MRVVLSKIKPVEYVKDITQHMFDMYSTLYNNLLFEPVLSRENPSTGANERYYSHPTTSRWYYDMHKQAQALYPNSKVRLLVAHLYSDGTSADDGAHHPVYLQLANSKLEHYQSAAGKRVVALLPSLPPVADLSSDDLAYFRLRAFHLALARLIAPFRELKASFRVAYLSEKSC